MLQEVFKRASELPDEVQDRIAALLLSEIDEDDDFDRLMAECPEPLDRLERRALEDLRNGRVDELDPDVI